VKSKYPGNLNARLLGTLLIFLALTVFGCDSSLQTPFGDTGTKHLVPKATQIVIDGLQSPDPKVRTNAIEVVAATRQDKLMPKVQSLLKDDFVPVRFSAALAAGDMQYHPAEDTLKRLLNAPDDNTRIAAAYALKKLGSPHTFELVREAVKSQDQILRANAVVLLGKSGDKSELELLQWTLTDDNSEDKVRFQALEAIARLGDERIFTRLWAIVYSSYADDRVIAVRAMGALGTKKAKDVLITKLDDDVLEVRLAAAEQLGTFGDITGQPEVLDVFEKNLTAGMDNESKQRVYVLTALAIGRIQTPALTRFLPRLLDNQSQFVRIAAAKAVFQCAQAN
jgi:HEAT repeat protein